VFDARAAEPPTSAHGLALDCLAAGIEAARPARAVDRHCSHEDGVLRIREATYDPSAYDDVFVLGGGKAADDLAAALLDRLGGPASGVVVTDARTADPDGVTVRLGEHPTPGAGSVSGADAVLERARAADEDALVLAPITGGGSALLCAPAGDLSAADLATVTERLLAAGAPVDAVNVVRRACSTIKGGGLAAAAAPATVVGLVVSDVVGDDPGVVASGPTVPLPTDPDDALAVLDRYGVTQPAVTSYLAAADPARPPDVAAETHVIASAADAVDAAARTAAESGVEPCVLSTRLEGAATEVGRFHAAVATEATLDGRPVEPPAVLLSGGETTVTVRGDGDGGPNMAFVVACGLDLPDSAVVAAVDTDGRDGGTDAAGAITGRLDDAEAARRALADDDTLPFLRARDALLETGSTGTNVNDLRIVVLEGKRFYPSDRGHES
jgi:hydroxypyruvate reductase